MKFKRLIITLIKGVPVTIMLVLALWMIAVMFFKMVTP